MNPYFIAGSVIAVVLAFGAGYWKGDEMGRAAVKQEWEHEKYDLMTKHTEEVEKAREKEQNWQQAADNIRQEKDREIRNINARATALSNSLRYRPSAPAANASSATQETGAGQTAAGCTGAELYREHAEAFAGEAARGDQIRAALKQCYAQYDMVN